MKRSFILPLILILPALAVAQSAAPSAGTGAGPGMGAGRMGGENGLLKSFGLTEAQIGQVTAIEKSTRDVVRADLTHIRLVQAQIAEALLPAAPDAQAINALIDKKGQLRVDIEKNLMSARIQLVKIMGSDDFAKYARSLMGRMRIAMGRGRMMGQRDWRPGAMRDLGPDDSNTPGNG